MNDNTLSSLSEMIDTIHRIRTKEIETSVLDRTKYTQIGYESMVYKSDNFLGDLYVQVRTRDDVDHTVVAIFFGENQSTESSIELFYSPENGYFVRFNLSKSDETKHKIHPADTEEDVIALALKEGFPASLQSQLKGMMKIAHHNYHETNAVAMSHWSYF